MEKKTLKKAEIIRTDGHIFARPILGELKQFLTIERRKIGAQPTKADGKPDWSKDRPLARSKEKLYLTQEEDWLVVPQGFYRDIYWIYRDLGYEVDLVDNRLPFPAPKWENLSKMRFRGSQLEKLKILLETNESGGFEAPTRYGKSIILEALLRLYPNVETVLAAPGAALLRQTYFKLKDKFPERDVKFVSARGKTMGKDLTVCSMDSLHKLDRENVRLLLVDEPHSMASESRCDWFYDFPNARRYAVGATWTGRFDKADKVITGIVGPVLSKTTYTEAVGTNNICPIRIYTIRIPIALDKTYCSKRHQALHKLVIDNQFFQNLMSCVMNEIIPHNWQTMMFIDEEKQADRLAEKISGARVAMSKKFKNEKEAEDFRMEMVAGNILRCIASSIYAVGLTFSDLRVMVNGCAGGGSITAKQKPGRLAETIPGKKRGYVVDYCFDPIPGIDSEKNSKAWAVIRNCIQRQKVYKEIGYEMVDVPLVLNEEKRRWEPDRSVMVFD